MLLYGGKTAFCSFFIYGRQIVSGLLHYFDDAVKRHTVLSVRYGCVQIGIQRSGGSIGVSFDAWYLNQPTYGIACQAKVVLKTHFGRVLDLGRCPAKQLGSCCCSHSAGYTHFSLTAHFGTGDGGVVSYHSSEEAGGSQCSQYALAAEIFGCMQMIQHGRHYTARTACGCCYNFAPAAFSSLTANA